jgi:3',5'-cyclic AMP phosphodiesterase CpdA
VILPGDLTQHARKEEYAKARQFVAKLLEQGNRVVFTPGNHDFGSWKGEHLPLFGRGPRLRWRELQRLVEPQTEVTELRGTDMLMVCENDAFLVLRSTHRGLKRYGGARGGGRIRAAQIEWAVEVLTRHRERVSSRRLHLVTHRSVWRSEGEQITERDKHKRMFRSDRLVDDLLTKFRFYSFIHGHNHRGELKRESLVDGRVELWRVGVPTLSTRNEDQRSGPSPLAPKVDHARGWVEWDLGQQQDSVPRMKPDAAASDTTDAAGSTHRTAADSTREDDG